MLAPSAEKLPAGPMSALCQRSLELYPSWISKLEDLTGQDSGYWPCGILAPVLSTSANTSAAAVTHPLNASTIHSYQPGLSSQVIGGDFYPDDAQVDSRSLMQALRMAAAWRATGRPLRTGHGCLGG